MLPLTLIAFILTWLGATAYTLFAILDPLLPYSGNTFWSFLIILDVLGFSLLWLWYQRHSRTIQFQAGIVVGSLILVFYWGFATVHSFMSLQLNALQLRWLGFVYIWEVVIVGAMVAWAVLRITRFADRFLKGEATQKDSAEDIHVRLAATPLRASMIYILMVVFGYAIGSLQLYIFSGLPLSEVIKNLLSGVVLGTLSSFVLFFVLERIIDPALRKSGLQLRAYQINEHNRFSLFTKIYAISGLLALVSVGFFGTVSYGRGQIILEEQLKRSSLDRLTLIALEYQEKKDLPLREVIEQHMGPHGSITVLTRSNQNQPYGLTESESFSDEAIRTIVANATKQASFIERQTPTRVVAMVPVDTFHTLLGTVLIDDFSTELNLLVFYSLFVLFMILAAIAIIGTLFARSITLPIKEIHAEGVRIGQGDFSRLVEVHTNDELEDLGNALNEAAAKLNASYHYLEKEVEQRTKDLEKANETQKEQISELDKASKLLVKRDFALQAANDSLRELDQAKTQFVSVAAHQLRTPLSVSKWTFEMLLSGDFGQLTKEQQEVLKRGNEMNEQMIDLVSDLLDVARIESGKLDYVFTALDLATFLPDIQQLFLQKSQERNVTLDLPIPRPSEYVLRADEVRLRMVFQNLIDNAFKFTPAGGKISLVFSRKDDMLECRISDTGIGISTEELPRLFTKFFRARNAVMMDTRGTGLGLYITASIIRTHGGTIGVESAIGRGTTFYFTLPIAKQ